MKKLITIIEEVGSVDTTNYPNIKFEGATASDKINLSLLSDINAAANAAGITISIGTAVTGHRETTSSGNVSRHTTGEAVDISRVNGVDWKTKSEAESKKILGGIESFVTNLRNAGYTVNSESGNPKSVLYFGFSQHDDHIHVSNKVGSPESEVSAKPGETTPSSAEEYATDTLINALSGAFKPLLGLNESKQKRIILNIEKIKNLIK
jgi:hypothetical protein